MALELLERFPLLLLLLGLWGPVCPLYALPPNLTKVQWFNIQHIHSGPLQCFHAMKRVNIHIRRCKSLNTFLHDSFQNVAAACMLPTTRCKNRWNNCHQSSKPVTMTTCNHTGGTYPDCQYSDDAQYKFFVIACDPLPRPGPPYHFVPVHLDKII
ncbi:ribonuclease K6-like [Molossus molossus]|uniref:Ribonuclease A-domain domain-containing protein n=1 Tax=Molossus molossus TaxID=27622 RepID=A0A7J8JZX8_MOLMO|nr:ribonuclease K6-like [Molossus molossus]KAF6502338.1 hypothetical protein HJG59_015660 [Molossus molossus]